MQKLLNPSICPPDGFKYRCPETGHWSVAEIFEDWVRDAWEHLKGNGLPIPPNLPQLMQEQLCSTLPAGHCESFDPNQVEPLTRIHRGDIIEGTKIFLKWFAQGRPLVDQAEAERRAGICAGCHLNVPVIGCSSCHEVAEGLTAKVKTSFDGRLIACAVCKCALKAKVWFPLTTLETTDSQWKQKHYVPQCWLKKGGKNYDAVS